MLVLWLACMACTNLALHVDAHGVTIRIAILSEKPEILTISKKTLIMINDYFASHQK